MDFPMSLTTTFQTCDSKEGGENEAPMAASEEARAPGCSSLATNTANAGCAAMYRARLCRSCSAVPM